MSRRWGDGGRSEASTGAWAAAAVVLGLGGLMFGVVAQVRTSSLEEQVERLKVEVQQEARAAAAPSTTLLDERQSTTVGRQPDSPDEARAGVQHAYEVVYDASKPMEERLSFVDDSTGVSDAIVASAAGPYAQQVAKTRVRVDDVTFNSAVGANVRYVVVSGGAAQLENRVGAARNVGGTWKVTRDTICADLAVTGSSCDA